MAILGRSEAILPTWLLDAPCGRGLTKKLILSVATRMPEAVLGAAISSGRFQRRLTGSALLRRRRASRGERFFQGVDLRLHCRELRAQRAHIKKHLFRDRRIKLGGITQPG
jgi:ribosomal protein L44E